MSGDSFFGPLVRQFGDHNQQDTLEVRLSLADTRDRFPRAEFRPVVGRTRRCGSHPADSHLRIWRRVHTVSIFGPSSLAAIRLVNRTLSALGSRLSRKPAASGEDPGANHLGLDGKWRQQVSQRGNWVRPCRAHR